MHLLFRTGYRTITPALDFKKINTLNFEEPDIKTFEILYWQPLLWKKVAICPVFLMPPMKLPCGLFLHNRIGFLDITAVVEKTMEKINYIEKPNLTDYFESDGEARNFAASLINL